MCARPSYDNLACCTLLFYPRSCHPGVAKVAFTGSAATGKRVAGAAAGESAIHGHVQPLQMVCLPRKAFRACVLLIVTDLCLAHPSHTVLPHISPYTQQTTGALRPATMELGGKSALLVFEDAEVEKAVEWAMFGR